MVNSINLEESGYFGGKVLVFSIRMPTENIAIKWTEKNFKWLSEMLTLEFPFAIQPPLIITVDKNLQQEEFIQTKIYSEKYLNELLKHKYFKCSQALEIFLTETDQKIFDQRRRDLWKTFNDMNLMKGGFLKKFFDNSSKSGLEGYQYPEKHLEVKFSPKI